MANFKLSEPPEMSGDISRDIEEIYAWCRELYEAFWVNEFFEMQKRKKEETDENKSS